MATSEFPQATRANQKFIGTAMKAPLLSAEHEHELARRWREQGDEAALKELVTAYMRLAIAAALRFRHYGLPVGDLVQEGNVGLMMAAARFEPERNVRFSTYASWWVRSSIQDFILRNWSIVRNGTTAAHKSLFFNLRRLRAKIETDVDGPLSQESKRRIARELRVKLADVEIMESRLSAQDSSLNAVVGEQGEAERQDFLPDERPNPEDVVLEMRDAETRAAWLNEALNSLTPRERTIIGRRRLQDEGVTLAVLGEELGISKERVRQIEQQAMVKLRTAIVDQAGDPVAAGLIS